MLLCLRREGEAAEGGEEGGWGMHEAEWHGSEGRRGSPGGVGGGRGEADDAMLFGRAGGGEGEDEGS